MQQRHNPFFFWSIVATCSLAVFSFWIFTIKDDVAVLFTSVQKDFSGAKSGLVDQWARSEVEAKMILGDKPVQLTDEQISQLAKEIENTAKIDSSASFPETKDVAVDHTSPVNPDKQVCTRAGGLFDTRKTSSGTSYSVCAFLDGSECEAAAFARGECHKGQYSKVGGDFLDLPDLMSEVTADYCALKGGDWQATNREQATHVCFDAVVVRNQASAVAPKSTLTVGGTSYLIPSLGSNKGYTLKQLTPVKITAGMKEVKIVVDANEKIKERDEKNNLAVFIVQ